MKEKEILRDTVRDGKPLEKKTKRYYKPRKKKEEEVTDPIKLVETKELKIPNTVGRYHIGGTKKFSIYMDKKPNWLHRKCMGIFLGWTWEDNK
jgi:hypothetical protein